MGQSFIDLAKAVARAEKWRQEWLAAKVTIEIAHP
jgi:hypothetical protein